MSHVLFYIFFYYMSVQLFFHIIKYFQKCIFDICTVVCLTVDHRPAAWGASTLLCHECFLFVTSLLLLI